MKMIEVYLSLGNKARTLERKKIASVRVDSKEYISVVKYKCVSVPNADVGVSSESLPGHTNFSEHQQIKLENENQKKHLSKAEL